MPTREGQSWFRHVLDNKTHVRQDCIFSDFDAFSKLINIGVTNMCSFNYDGMTGLNLDDMDLLRAVSPIHMALRIMSNFKFSVTYCGEENCVMEPSHGPNVWGFFKGARYTSILPKNASSFEYSAEDAQSLIEGGDPADISVRPARLINEFEPYLSSNKCHYGRYAGTTSRFLRSVFVPLPQMSTLTSKGFNLMDEICNLLEYLECNYPELKTKVDLETDWMNCNPMYQLITYYTYLERFRGLKEDKYTIFKILSIVRND